MSDDAIPMLLWCPGCGARHLDVGEFATKLHHTHACQTCGMIWRPAIVATVGVQFLPGFKNVEPAAPAQPLTCILGGARCPAAGACDDGCVRAPASPAPERTASLGVYEQQRRSFAYGNTKIENDRITKELVDRVADEMASTPKHGGE